MIVTAFLKNEGSLFVKTKDGSQVGRVHHEYPTPFRCLMDHYNFRMITEDEFKQERQKNPRFAAKRGRIDLVVLNSDYISSNALNTVTGRRYEGLLESANQQKHSALDLAMEVVYFPTQDEKPHKGIMEHRVQSTLQDYKKLVELMTFNYLTGVSYCKQAAMLFFSNTTHMDALNETFDSFPKDPRGDLFKVLYDVPKAR